MPFYGRGPSVDCFDHCGNPLLVIRALAQMAALAAVMSVEVV